MNEANESPFPLSAAVNSWFPHVVPRFSGGIARLVRIWGGLVTTRHGPATTSLGCRGTSFDRGTPSRVRGTPPLGPVGSLGVARAH